MPKISAPTVAEHRAQRLRTLLEAARVLVAEQGPDALTLSALATQVGLSRPSLYEYFRSRDDLVAAMVEDELPRWIAELDAEVQRHSAAADRIAAFVRAQLRMLTDGRHTALVVLAGHALGPAAQERVMAEHSRLFAPLVTALTDLGVDQPELRAHLIQGIVNAASPLLGADELANRRVIDAATTQVLHGIPDITR
ncbi:TetR/AcrR family transcriptional regulator [Kutzneria sp. CA-103260]|uniref:TetR/AcrR family transcriptional regulator n=1 Tax=Kutzneria sp. CA-103260 TaxID=2802641 RepID=UPI001BAB7272|nr:TetR/AcrR family transcriptional regulator [Kutzneria sp. CA-103260]QUQ66013.1 TetR/AcrR family transcriptional regulator [Kutzneria sp. CA-103260]